MSSMRSASSSTKHFDAAQVDCALLGEIEQTARRCDQQSQPWRSASICGLMLTPPNTTTVRRSQVLAVAARFPQPARRARAWA